MRCLFLPTACPNIYRCKHCGQKTAPTPHPPAQIYAECQARPGAAPRGPGRILTDLIASLELPTWTQCGCAELAKKMDTWGIDGCTANRPEILAKLRVAATKVPYLALFRAARKGLARGLHLNPFNPASSLLDTALRRSASPPELIFNFPPGIGDCSWVYSKIAALAERRNIGVRVGKSGLPRALEFVRLLPSIELLGWGEPFTEHLEFVELDADLAALPNGEYNLFANPHLEAGNRLETLWPKQETRYHYRIDTTPAMFARAAQITGRTDGQLIGFYCSSGRKDCRWQNIWRIPQWIELLEGMHPTPTFVAIGANYDTRTPAVAKTLRSRGHRVLECIGSQIGTTIEVLKRLDYFVAYPSGLGILGDVIDTPTLMFYWPAFHDPFVNTYADPKNVANGRHLNVLFCPPAKALRIFHERGAKWIN